MSDLFPPKRNERISENGLIDKDHAKFLEDSINVLNHLQIIDGDPIGNLVTDKKMIVIRQDGGVNTTLYVNEIGDGTFNGWRAI